MIGLRAPSQFHPLGVVGTFCVVAAFHELECSLENPQTYEQMLRHRWV